SWRLLVCVTSVRPQPTPIRASRIRLVTTQRMRSVAPSSPDANAPHLHDGRLLKTRPNHRVVRTSSRHQVPFRDVLDDDTQVSRSPLRSAAHSPLLVAAIP